jgi:hypothetical protein
VSVDVSVEVSGFVGLVGSGRFLNSIILAGRKLDGIDLAGRRPARSITTYWDRSITKYWDRSSRSATRFSTQKVMSW